jgi:CDGSH iron-sulfur domain-containing protein 3
MAEPALVAQKGPYEFEVKQGEKYLWCACGRSATQPICDGTHKGTGLLPKLFVAKKDETVWLCGCKQTGTQPFCDGTHNTL